MSWQVAWWALVPLAIAAMTQPCGNVLGLGAGNTRFFNRASPILCIADLLQFLLFVLLGFSFDRRKWLRNIQYEIRLRFQGERGAVDLQNAENTTTMRWVLLGVSGVACQSVKLVAMQGIPATKMYALLFLVSILFGETLIIFARSMRASGALTGASPRWRGFLGATLVQDSFVFAPLFLHSVIVWTVSIALFSEHQLHGAVGRPISLDGNTGFSYSRARYLNRWFERVGILPLALLGTRFFFLVRCFGILRCLAMLFVVFLFYSQVLLHMFHDAFSVFMYGLFSWCYISSAANFFVWLGYAVLAVSLSYLGLFLVPFLLNRVEARRVLRITTATEWQAFLIFIESFVISLSYYSLAFDSYGTVNPPWTGVFG